MTDMPANDYQDLLREVRKSQFSITGSALLLAIVGLLTVALLWAAFAEVDEVTKGQGKVVPSQKVQVIQSLEGGIIRNIMVREGEAVVKDQVLLELDQAQRRSEYDQNVQQYYGYLATSYRLKAEMNGTAPVFPPELEANAPAVLASETMLFESRRDALASEVKVLESQLFQRKQELAEARLGSDTAAKGLTLASDEANIIRPLVERGLEPKISLLQLERTINEMTGKKGASELAVQRLTAAIREIEDKRDSALEGYRAKALAELSIANTKVAELSASTAGAKDKLDRAQLRAPVNGIVNRLHVKSIGTVVQGGMPLAEVVPTDDTMRVEGYIKPSDIAFLHPGQKVKVKLTAYDYARYGSLDGTLVTVGVDTVEMPNKETMFPVEIETSGTLLDADGKPLEISPGMVAEVDVLTGKKTILDYLVRPVVKVKSGAFRE